MRREQGRFFYSCNQCGGIHEAGMRPVLCVKMAALARAVEANGIPFADNGSDRALIEEMARTDEELRP